MIIEYLYFWNALFTYDLYLHGKEVRLCYRISRSTYDSITKGRRKIEIRSMT